MTQVSEESLSLIVELSLTHNTLNFNNLSETRNEYMKLSASSDVRWTGPRLCHCISDLKCNHITGS